MKIAFIGTHGTGKTTLSYSLTGELKKLGINAMMITETARKCPLPINKDCAFASQLWIMTTQICQEIELQSVYNDIVCDRSVLDGYVYALVTGCANLTLEKLAEDWIKTYDYLFKVPITRPLSADGIRSMDDTFQRAVDETMDKVLKEKGVKFFNLPTENQIEFVIDIIKKNEM